MVYDYRRRKKVWYTEVINIEEREKGERKVEF
jgi:hypothetical protein